MHTLKTLKTLKKLLEDHKILPIALPTFPQAILLKHKGIKFVLRFFCSQNSKHEARHKICQATIILIHGFKTYRTMKMGVTAEHDGGDDRNMLVK